MLQRTKTFVRISEKFELTNFELSDGFCQDQIAITQKAKKLVRIGESSNYRVFELTGVDCIFSKRAYKEVNNDHSSAEYIVTSIIMSFAQYRLHSKILTEVPPTFQLLPTQIFFVMMYF